MSVAVPWPAANARLLDLRARGTAIDDFGDVSVTNPTTLWTGDLEAFIKRERKTIISGGANTPVDFDVLIVRDPPKVLTDAKSGDEGTGHTILVRDQRDGTNTDLRFRITALEHRGAGESRSVRLELADEPL